MMHQKLYFFKIFKVRLQNPLQKFECAVYLKKKTCKINFKNENIQYKGKMNLMFLQSKQKLRPINQQMILLAQLMYQRFPQ